MSTESPLVIHTGSLLSNLDQETQARVLELRYMRRPLVEGMTPFVKMIQEKLMKYGYFDISLGKFIRTKITLGGAKLGPMGWINSDGYRVVQIARYNWHHSHLVYIWFTGKLVEMNNQMDHISGDRLDDRPSNLRLILKAINARNAKKRIDNTSGHTGVGWHSASGKWSARCGDIWLGLFNTPEEAYTARKAYIKTRPELGYTTRHGS